MVRETLRKLAAMQDLTADDITAFIGAVAQDDVSEAVIAAFLMGMLAKGVTAAETTAIARAMMRMSVPIRPRRTDLMDTCGTGGGLATINISIASGLLCAAAGMAVAKHGSRSLFSTSGSADLLEALGVTIDLPVAAVEAMIDEVGFGFIHAPNFHPVMRRLLTVETALGIKTIFYSLIGPLISPAQRTRHLLGVYREDWLDLAAQALRELGLQRAMVVYGEDGIDEISLLGRTRIHELRDGALRVYQVTPEELGLARCGIDAIKSLGPQGNAELTRQIFAGTHGGAARDAILLNSAGALVVGGMADSLREGVQLARELIDSGAVARKLAQVVEAARDLAPSARAGMPPVAPRQRSAERIWHGVLQASPDAILLVGRDGRIEQANGQAGAQLRRTGAELAGQAYRSVLPPALAEPRMEKIADAMASGVACRWDDAEQGSYFDNLAIPVDDGSGVVVVVRDRTGLARAEASEQDKRARLKTLIESLPDLVWLVDMDGRLLNCNHKFERLAGREEAALKGLPLAQVLPAPLAAMLVAETATVMQARRPVTVTEWLEFATSGGREYSEIILAPFIDQQERMKGVMGIARDVTLFQQNEMELLRQRAALRDLVYTDVLTGLPTRQAQTERIQHLIDSGTVFSLVAISPKNFSRIFSHFGSSMSDAVILAIANALRGVMPAGFELYRAADTRFAVIAAQAGDPVVLEQFAAQVMACVSRALPVGEAALFINLAIGIASFPVHGTNTDQIIGNAAAALDEAEAYDGTAYRLFAPFMLDSIRYLQWLDQNLRLALECGQFQLHYQPKIALDGLRVQGVEALIRWHHPERGNIRPDEFISRCESNGLIVALGNWVLDTAAAQAAAWRAAGRPLRIAVNVSGKQLLDPELLARLRQAQATAHGLLDIELTESSLLTGDTTILSAIEEARALQCGIHLDDFGTGYSCLSALASLPLTVLKLDRVFIQEIGRPGNGQALLTSMVGMARALGLQTVAEGVELDEQIAFLRSEGVDAVQGWRYCAALPADQLDTWLTQHLQAQAGA